MMEKRWGEGRISIVKTKNPLMTKESYYFFSLKNDVKMMGQFKKFFSPGIQILYTLGCNQFQLIEGE